MSDRITNRDLEALVRILHREKFGTVDVEPWTRGEGGRLQATIGAYYIDGAYSGVALYQMVTDGGGVSDVLHCGHVSKRDLYNRMRAYLEGMEAGQHTTTYEDRTNLDRALNGREIAVLALNGSEHMALEDYETGLVDALANLMHFARRYEIDFDSSLDSARMHHDAEKRTPWSEAPAA